MLVIAGIAVWDRDDTPPVDPTAGIAVLGLPRAGASTATFGIAAGGSKTLDSDGDLDRHLAGLRRSGATWLRFDIDWSAIQPDGPGTYEWADVDAAVAAAKRNDLRVLGLLTFSPDWARRDGSDNHQAPPERVEDFARFAATAVARYGPRGVRHWEVWNEPNNDGFWEDPDPDLYADLLEETVDAIKHVDSGAFVVSGGLSPAADDGTDVAPVTFLKRLYKLGAMTGVDAVGHHPYSEGRRPSEAPQESGWGQMVDEGDGIRVVMIEEGDAGKPIWATEYGAPTGGEGSVDESLQADIATEAVEFWSRTTWGGVLFWYSYRDRCDDGAERECRFGLVRRDYAPKPAFDAFRRAVTRDG